ADLHRGAGGLRVLAVQRGVLDFVVDDQVGGHRFLLGWGGEDTRAIVVSPEVRAHTHRCDARAHPARSWFAGLLPIPAAPPATAANDADIYAQIDALRPVAESITVDGNPADWGAIPAFADPSGDAGGDPSRDVTSVRIAPTANALYVLIQTAG